MKKELNYLASKKWEKVGRQELRSTPYKQEIDPRFLFYTEFIFPFKTFLDLVPNHRTGCLSISVL
jgi:hypothetical protein